MKAVRWVLGRIILFLNFVCTPRSVKRPQEQQEAVNAATAQLTLYQFASCPFCVKVRRAMKRHALNIETRDAKRNEQFKEELVNGGGSAKVPCLRISNGNEVQWMYESSDIIAYLEERFASEKTASA